MLDELGWDAEWAAHPAGPGEPARVVRVDGARVTAATGAGEVSPRRVAAHAALRREVAWLRGRYDARERAERRREWTQPARAVRAGRRASPRGR